MWGIHAVQEQVPAPAPARAEERHLSAAERSSAAWCRYFRWNREHLLGIPWDAGAGLSAEEQTLIARSLAEFQQGEGQEGGHFFRCARTYAEQTADWGYIEAHRLFMAEEQRHARDVARFLTLAGIPLLTERSALTHLFCWFGSRGGLEATLLIILMSEVLGQTYYSALWRATGSPVLRRLCAQVLRDEKAHVRFQCDRLRLLRLRRSGWVRALLHGFDNALFLAACLACWMGHRGVLRAGGFGLWRFCRTAFRHLRTARRLAVPRDRPQDLFRLPWFEMS